MRKILMIIRREYRQAVHTKAFWIGTLVLPLLMVLMFALPIGLSMINPENQKTIAFIDETGQLLEPLRESLAEHELKDGSAEYVIEAVELDGSMASTLETQKPRVWNDELYGLLTVKDGLESESDFGFYRKNVGDNQTQRTVRRALGDAVVGLRLERSNADVDKEELERLTDRIQLGSFQVTAGGESKKKGFLESYLVTYIFVMMLYFMLYFYGFAVTRGVLQEKTSRVMEVLLGSVSPEQLMTGKILGIGLVGLTQMGIYLSTIGLLRVAILSFQFFEDPGAILDAIAPGKLVFFLLYFVLGYFLFVTMFAMIGAVCNSEQEAQNFQVPVMLSLMIPMISTIFFVQHPDTTAAMILSLVPIFTPMLMFMRISVLTPPAWQIALSIVLMLGTIWVMFGAAARVFRIGTLMYGKRPTVTEIFRWARRSAS